MPARLPVNNHSTLPISVTPSLTHYGPGAPSSLYTACPASDPTPNVQHLPFQAIDCLQPLLCPGGLCFLPHTVTFPSYSKRWTLGPVEASPLVVGHLERWGTSWRDTSPHPQVGYSLGGCGHAPPVSSAHPNRCSCPAEKKIQH